MTDINLLVYDAIVARSNQTAGITTDSARQSRVCGIRCYGYAVPAAGHWPLPDSCPPCEITVVDINPPHQSYGLVIGLLLRVTIGVTRARPRRAFWNTAIRPSVSQSVCLSHGAAAYVIGTLAACSLATRDVRTADPSADGRRSNCHWRGHRVRIRG